MISHPQGGLPSDKPPCQPGPRIPPRTEVIVRLLAPYLAILVFWFGFHSAWLTILAYHAQCVFWNRRRRRQPRSTVHCTPSRIWLPALVTALAGPVLYFLLPVITRTDLSPWLASHGLGGRSLLVMVPYYGILHPILEQLHWSPLRSRTPIAHLLFAGYHILILYSLLQATWLAACFLILLLASVMWQAMERRSGGLVIPIASHALGDFGIVLVAALLR